MAAREGGTHAQLSAEMCDRFKVFCPLQQTFKERRLKNTTMNKSWRWRSSRSAAQKWSFDGALVRNTPLLESRLNPSSVELVTPRYVQRQSNRSHMLGAASSECQTVTRPIKQPGFCLHHAGNHSSHCRASCSTTTFSVTSCVVRRDLNCPLALNSWSCSLSGPPRDHWCFIQLITHQTHTFKAENTPRLCRLENTRRVRTTDPNKDGRYDSTSSH